MLPPLSSLSHLPSSEPLSILPLQDASEKGDDDRAEADEEEDDDDDDGVKVEVKEWVRMLETGGVEEGEAPL